MSTQGNVVPGPKGARPLDQFDSLSPIKWESTPATPLDWIVDGCFLRGTVAILSGDGGLGKSLLCQQLLTASAAGQRWLGMRTKQCRGFGLFAEETTESLHRRQENINRHYDCEMHHLEGVRYAPRFGRDCVLMAFSRWGDEGHQKPLMQQVTQAAMEHKAQIVVLDPLADIFSGNEVDRNQPRTFIRELTKLAIRIQGVVIVTQHPSVEGIASGSGRSGSTGWNNSVKSRLYLTVPKKKDDDAAQNERFLKTMKSNEGPWGGKIKLVWERGVFRRADEQPMDNYWNRENDNGCPF